MLPLVQADSRPDWFDKAPDEYVQLHVYLVTAAKLVNDEDTVQDPPLKDPAELDKQQFHEALLDSLANPVSCPGRGRRKSAEVSLDIHKGVCRRGQSVQAIIP